MGPLKYPWSNIRLQMAVACALRSLGRRVAALSPATERSQVRDMCGRSQGGAFPAGTQWRESEMLFGMSDVISMTLLCSALQLGSITDVIALLEGACHLLFSEVLSPLLRLVSE